jgi:hypothetical protein
MLNQEVLQNVIRKLLTHMSFKSNTFKTIFELFAFLWGPYYNVI